MQAEYWIVFDVKLCRWRTSLMRLPRLTALHRAGVLFRAYPGPWQVLRGSPLDPQNLHVIHTQDTMPTLKEVALDILPRRRAQN